MASVELLIKSLVNKGLDISEEIKMNMYLL